ncbi:unnamed protein product [Discosporangium mesarthrocarpum]
MKTAGDRLVADWASLDLTRLRVCMWSILPPPELSLPQLCLSVSAAEVAASFGRKGIHPRGAPLSSSTKPGQGQGQGQGEGEGLGCGVGEGEGELPKLFQERRPLVFFPVDCRPREQVAAGRFPTAYHLDPTSMEDPEEMSKLLSVFEPLRGHAHICLVGTGDGQGLRGGSGGRGGAGSRKAARDDYSYVNMCALSFVKRGFPFVSMLEGVSE